MNTLENTVTTFATSKFNIENFKAFIREIFGANGVFEFAPIRFSTTKYKMIKESCDLLPNKSIKFKEILDLGIYAFKVDSINAKAGLHKELKDIMEHSTLSAIVACFFDEGASFRLSLITRRFNKNNKIEFSNLKRQSYILGEGINTRTAIEQLVKLKDAKSIEDLNSIFALEPLSKDFFSNISLHFLDLIENITFPNHTDQEARSFALRLISRVLFCKFLEKKEIIKKELWDINLSSNYYHEVLEPLFFGSLNTPKSKRDYKFLDPKIKSLLLDIPYLNGGLFAPQETDYYGLEFSTTLKVPNKPLKDFLAMLDNFHFTIDESTPLDQEVGLDPEMLGLVFENLLSILFTDNKIENLSSLRKQTGSFYTPREIVSHMVKSSILEHIIANTSLDESKLKDLIFNHENNFNHNETLSILSALFNFKILDPACGSGAFPIGMLQEICAILETLDKEAKAFINLQSEEFKSQNKDKSPAYIRKLSILQNNIYGVDIQPMATEIARLRCFLSLVCEEDKSHIAPLPNLEFKFVNANSLVPLVTSLDDIFSVEFRDDYENLKKLRQDFFEASTNKEELKEKYNALKQKIQKESIQVGIIDEEDTKLLDYDPFKPQSIASFFDSLFMFGVDGFDCIIGNPPYIRQERIKHLKPALQKHYKSIYNGTADIYTYFFALGFNLLKPKGLLSFITSNKWTKANYGINLRSFLLDSTKIKSYIDFNGQKIFASATVDTSIISFTKDAKESNHLSYLLVENLEDLNKDHSSIPQASLSKDSFIFASPLAQNLKSKLETLGTPLKDWDISIKRGVLTGYNEAFIITTEKREEILNSCDDLVSDTLGLTERARTNKLIRPILRGRDVKAYSYQWAGLWIIGTFPSLKLEIDQYPSLKAFLESFRPRINQSGEKGCRKKTSNKWFETQDNIAYYGDFEKEKIVYSEIVRSPQFFLDEREHFFAEATSFIMTGENLKYLTGLLNTSFVASIFKNFYAGGGLGSEGYRYKKAFLERLPIPKITEENKDLANKIVSLVDEILEMQNPSTTRENPSVKSSDASKDHKALQKQIDSLVYDLYSLNEEEIKIIEGR